MVSLVLTPCFCENGLCWWSSNFADVAGYSQKKWNAKHPTFFREYPVVAEKCGKSLIFHKVDAAQADQAAQTKQTKEIKAEENKGLFEWIFPTSE